MNSRRKTFLKTISSILLCSTTISAHAQNENTSGETGGGLSSSSNKDQPADCKSAKNYGDRMLCLIQNNTRQTLERVNELPAQIQQIVLMAKSWLETKDDNNIIGNSKDNFIALQQSAMSASDLSAMANKLSETFLKAGSPTGDLPGNPNAYNYTSLIGYPMHAHEGTDTEKKKQAEDEKNYYLTFASGSTYPIAQVKSGWDAKKPAAMAYTGYYNTLAAIQSYNNYIISGITNQQRLEATLDDLANKANDEKWLLAIGDEPLGLVLRQILMYTSQSFLQLNRMMKMQQQQLIVQSMTNTLLMIIASREVGKPLIDEAGREARA